MWYQTVSLRIAVEVTMSGAIRHSGLAHDALVNPQKRMDGLIALGQDSGLIVGADYLKINP